MAVYCVPVQQVTEQDESLAEVSVSLSGCCPQYLLDVLFKTSPCRCVSVMSLAELPEELLQPDRGAQWSRFQTGDQPSQQEAERDAEVLRSPDHGDAGR